MHRLILFLALFLLPSAGSAQWHLTGPRHAAPVAVAHNSQYVFAGTDAAGGLFRSADDGQTWEPAGSTIPWDKEVIAVGASDALVAVISRISGSKTDLYRSTDNGNTWKTTANFLAGKGKEAVYVMGADTLVVVASSSSRYELHVSTDGGATWTAQPAWDRQVYGQPPVMVGQSLVTYRYEPAANNQYTYGLYVSSDLGATWTFRPYFTGSTSQAVTGIHAVDGHRFWFRSANEFVSGGGTRRVLLWTDDLGQAYHRVELPNEDGVLPTFDEFAVRGQTLVARGFRNSVNTGSGITQVHDHVFAVSTDGGATWAAGDADGTMLRLMDATSPTNLGLAFGLYATERSFLYGFQQYSGITGMVHHSVDGLDWLPSKELGIGRVLGSTTPFGETLLAFEGGGPNGTGSGYFRSTDGGDTWLYHANTFYTSQGEQMTCARTLAPGLVVSLDSVAVALCGDKVMHSRDGMRFDEVAAAPEAGIKMLVADGGSVYAVTWRSSITNGGTSGKLYRSEDAGRTWAETSALPRILTRPDALGNRLIYADDGAAYTSLDGGQTWSTFVHTSGSWKTTQIGAAATPTAFFVSAASTSWLYPDAFFRSTDDGQTWQNLKDLGLNDAPMFLHAEGDLLVAAFHDSVAVSQDDGATWTGLREGWPVGTNTRAQMGFVFDSTLFIQLENNSIWSAPLAAFGVVTAVAEETPTPALHVAAYPNPTRGASRISFTLDRAQQVQLVAYDLLGREVARLAEGATTAGTHDLSWQMEGLAAGLYVLRLTTEDGRAETRTLVKL